MADLIDKAESDMSQMINRVGSQAVSRGGRAAVKLSINVARSVTNAPYAAAAAVWGAARRAVHEATDTGKVTLKTFSNLADGRREVITLDDQAVSRELEKELKRHGVTWAMEKQSDGSTTFHVQGADIELVQHALGVAAERVDERLVRRGGDRQEQPQQEQSAQEQAREHDGTEQEQSVAERDDQVPQQAAPERDEYDEPVQADSVGAHGTDELREDAPARSSADDATVEHNQPAATAERDEAVADRGGHSEQRDPAASRAEQAPQISARDQTRRRNADRIDKKVTEKKAELSADKARTKKRGPRRDTANEARPTRRG